MHELPPPQLQIPCRPALSFWRRYGMALQLAALGAFLFLVAANTQSGWILVISSAMASLLLIEGGLLLSMRSGKQLELFFETSTLECGREGEVRLVVRNLSHNTKNGAILELPLPTTIPDVPSCKRFFIAKIPAHSSVIVKFKLCCSVHGFHKWGRPNVQYSYPWGVWQGNKLKLKELSGESAYIKVIPRPLEGWEYSPSSSSGYWEDSLPRRGNGDDLYCLRPYQSGDDLRRVHWASSAHAGDLIVREFQTQAEQAELCIAVDATQATPLINSAQSHLESALRLASTIIALAERRNIKVTLVTLRGTEVIVCGGSYEELREVLTDIQTELTSNSTELLCQWLRNYSRECDYARFIYITAGTDSHNLPRPEELAPNNTVFLHFLPERDCHPDYFLEFFSDKAVSETGDKGVAMAQSRQRRYIPLSQLPSLSFKKRRNKRCEEVVFDKANRYDDNSAYITGNRDLENAWRWLTERL